MGLFEWLLIIGVGIILVFAYSLLFGAPLVPSLRADLDRLFEYLGPASERKFIDIGAGDGRVVRAAARRGFLALGYEINPLFAAWASLRVRRQVGARVVCANALRAPWPRVDVVYIFGMERMLRSLHAKIQQQVVVQRAPILLVSYGFAVPGKKADKKLGAYRLYNYNYTVAKRG